MLQSYHNIASAIVDSENILQVTRLLEVTISYANMIEAEAGRPPLDTIDFMATDNSDALQAAATAIGSQPVNCKVHIMRGVKDHQSSLRVPAASSVKDIVASIRHDIFSVSELTLFVGTSRFQRDIAQVAYDLFLEKLKQEQPDFARGWVKEHTGDSKGCFMRAQLGPGIPNDTNTIESYNCQFKDEGATASSTKSVSQS